MNHPSSMKSPPPGTSSFQRFFSSSASPASLSSARSSPSLCRSSLCSTPSISPSSPLPTNSTPSRDRSSSSSSWSLPPLKQPSPRHHHRRIPLARHLERRSNRPDEAMTSMPEPMLFLPLIPILPFIGFLLNGLLGRHLPKPLVSTIALLFPLASFVIVARDALMFWSGNLAFHLSRSMLPSWILAAASTSTSPSPSTSFPSSCSWSSPALAS